MTTLITGYLKVGLPFTGLRINSWSCQQKVKLFKNLFAVQEKAKNINLSKPKLKFLIYFFIKRAEVKQLDVPFLTTFICFLWWKSLIEMLEKISKFKNRKGKTLRYFFLCFHNWAQNGLKKFLTEQHLFVKMYIFFCLKTS